MGDLPFLFLFLVLAFVFGFVAIPPYIRILYRYRLGKNIRTEALVGQASEYARLHQAKAGTPTMGGGVILLVILVLVALSIIAQAFSPVVEELFGVTIRFSLWNRNETYIALFTLFVLGAVGAVDDYMNVRGIGRTKGLSARLKFALLILFGMAGGWWFFEKLGYSSVALPVLGSLDIGIFYIPLFIFVILAMANSVNFTDGLDGLAGGLLLFGYGVYAFIAYDKWLLILSAVCMLVVGTLVAFLWYNIKPAQFIMGDVGSLSLGATLGVIAMMTDTLVVLAIISGIFALELFSVVIQITSKKLRGGKKVFRIAPYHHHLEALGWREETVVMRLWLVGLILSVVGLVVYLLTR